MILERKRRIDARFRLQANADTPDGMLLQYLIDLDSRSANSLIFQHLRMTLLPLVYQELGELSPEQLKFKVLEAVTALEDYGASIRQMFHIERQICIERQMVPVAIVSNGNGSAEKSADANPNSRKEQANSNGSPQETEAPEEKEEESFFIEGAGTPADCDQFFIGLD